jgi:hypothetical protein
MIQALIGYVALPELTKYGCFASAQMFSQHLTVQLPSKAKPELGQDANDR